MSGILRKTMHSYSNVTKSLLNSANSLPKLIISSQLTLATNKNYLAEDPSKESCEAAEVDTAAGQPDPAAATGPPCLPSTCCMSGCANCVWLDFAEETVNYYKDMGEEMEFTALLKEVEKNIDDPMIKAFITMELKSKYLFKKS
eukprot:GFUD01011313.1.p1 GENE.GFUD01011313.1~~GFUD01011313.1.p1  ORF type:complete len:144 (-),score=44.34 GFUD01011313.1:81-512(-)